MQNFQIWANSDYGYALAAIQTWHKIIGTPCKRDKLTTFYLDYPVRY